MKILEISGCNLASLQGEFRIALDKAPFSRDGLFAIRGVTGSGKSTLIDAMCLALYDDTPRFVGRGGPRVGLADQDDKDRVSATDPKSVLQRGAWQGWAQVIFRGVDGHRWRAKWSVARAHRRADGRLKDQEMEVEDLDTQERIGGNKRDVLKAIQCKVGLTFEQFRRSVLLAQGEFAAFAKANEDERAGLLEAMTGTGIYAELSKAAQKRSALEDQRLKDLHAERDSLGLLGNEARNGKESEVGILTGRIEQQEKEQAEVSRDLGWYARCSELQSQQSDAALKVENAEAAFAQAEARRQQLRWVDEAQPLRQLHADRIRTWEQQTSQEKQVNDRLAELPLAEQSMEAASLAFQGKQEALAKAHEAIEAAKPNLDAARALDTRIQEAQVQFQKASEEAGRLCSDALNAEQARDASVSEEKRVSKQLDKVAQELEATGSLQLVAQSWPRIDKDIQAFGNSGTSLDEARAFLAKVQDALSRQATTRSSLQKELGERASSMALQRKELDTLEQKMASEPRAALDESRRTYQSKLDRCRQAETILQRLHPLLDLLATSAAEVRTQASAKAKALEDVQASDRQLQSLDGGLSEAKSALEKAQAALSLEEHRHQLVNGEPCPLCGSLDHPWSAGSPLVGLLGEQKQRVLKLEQCKAQLEKERTTANTQMAQADKAEAKALKESKTHAANASKEEQAWNDMRLTAPDLPEDARSPHAMTVVRERILDLEEQLALISSREAALLKVEKQAEKLRREYRENEEKRKVLDGGVAEVDEELRRLKIQEAEHTRDVSNLESTLHGLRDALAPYLDASAMDALDRDPESLRASLAARVAGRKKAESVQVELTQKLVELGKTLEGQRATATEKRSAVLSGDGKQKDAEKALGGLQEERKGYFEGHSALEVEKALKAIQAASEKALEEARGASQAADLAVGDLHHSINALQDQLSSATAAAESAHIVFWDAMAHCWEGDLDDLEACLAWPPAQILSERTALQAIETERSKAMAVLDEYRKALDTHLVPGHPQRALEELDVLARSIKTALDDLKNSLGGLQADLRRDDLARQNATALAGSIQEQEARAKLWKEMNDLIGSADGKKFRTFAQSLTLEALVAFANEQLARLNPRYRLQRIPGYELELQVIDQDMGDEIRALNSLSGGETFLVSLALALGLSSLSASDTPIESLFIDEGFGTLDSETLETALSVLDELQSQGRQVGIISHVDGLATHIPIQISVEKLGGGRSRVVLPSLGRVG